MLFKHYLILLICVFGTTVFAQSETPKHMLGLEVGASRNWWSYGSGSASEQGVKERYSFVTGLNYRYSFNRHISVGGTLLWERKGVSASRSIVFSDAQWQGTQRNFSLSYQNFDYISFSPQLYCGFGEQCKPYIGIGPYVGYVVNTYTEKGLHGGSTYSGNGMYTIEIYGQSESGTFTGTYKSFETFEAFSIDRNFNRFDYGLNFSLGLDLDLGKNWHLVTSLRRSMGLAEVVKRSDIQSNQRNQSLVFSMAALYSF